MQGQLFWGCDEAVWLEFCISWVELRVCLWNWTHPPLATLLCFQVLFPNVCDWQARCWAYPCTYCFLFDQSPWRRSPSVICSKVLNPSLASPQGADIQWVWVGPHCLGRGTLHTGVCAPRWGPSRGRWGQARIHLLRDMKGQLIKFWGWKFVCVFLTVPGVSAPNPCCSRVDYTYICNIFNFIL